MPIWILFVIIATLLFLILISNYNRFAKLNNASEEAFKSIDVFLKQRYELIPNLIETIRGATDYESSTLERVISLRNTAIHGGTSEKAAAEHELSSLLPRILAIGEQYPQLKAVDGFGQLQNTLSHLEEEIQRARRYYNATARDLNTAVDSFPGNIVAGLFGITKRPYFDVPQAETQPVKVSFK